MAIRYEIALGAKTTAGGEVVTADPLSKIDGIPVAREDDQVACPACKSVGVIKPDGPRLDDLCDQKMVALSGDLCICKCRTPPRLIESQTRCYQVVDDDWYAGKADVAGAAALQRNAAASGEPQADGFPLLLLDPHTDQPYRHRAYRLVLAKGSIEGTTDENGATRPLSAAERATFVRWHVDPDSTPA